VVRLVEVLALHLLGPGQGGGEGGPSPLLDRLGAEGLKKVVVGDAGYLYPELAGKVVQKGGRTSSSLKGNQGELLEWALEVFKGMEERRLPGETEAVCLAEWASPYLPEEIRAWVHGDAGGGALRRTVSYALTSLGLARRLLLGGR
jgi:hypothetical protein